MWKSNVMFGVLVYVDQILCMCTCVEVVLRIDYYATFCQIVTTLYVYDILKDIFSKELPLLT